MMLLFIIFITSFLLTLLFIIYVNERLLGMSIRLYRYYRNGEKKFGKIYATRRLFLAIDHAADYSFEYTVNHFLTRSFQSPRIHVIIERVRCIFLSSLCVRLLGRRSTQIYALWGVHNHARSEIPELKGFLGNGITHGLQ